MQPEDQYCSDRLFVYIWDLSGTGRSRETHILEDDFSL